MTGTGTISALGGFNLAVSAFSDNIEGAKAFVVWAATDPQAQRLLATQGSVPPTLASVYEELAGDPVMAMLGQVLPDARPRPPSPNWSDISLEMQRQLFDAYNGEADPRTAAENVRAYLESTLS
jgi:multiple sugar transport system substrate-binding protein